MKNIFMMVLAIAIVSTSFANDNGNKKNAKKKSNTEHCCEKGKCCKKAVKA